MEKIEIGNGYWVICTQSYENDGIEIPKGRMNFHQSLRPIMNPKWRRATTEEIKGKQRFKGNWFNLKTFKSFCTANNLKGEYVVLIKK